MPLNILFGLPDDQKAHVHVVDDGRRLSFDLPGTADIVPHLSPKRFASELIYLHPAHRQPARLRPGPLLNHIGDPDSCSVALELARQVVQKTGRPCFNHPDAIAGTTRDRVAQVLAGIDGLLVPRTIRVATPQPAEVCRAVEEGGLRYPMLVRVAGAHGGSNMVKIDAPSDMAEIDKLDRNVRSALYVTEFVDFAGQDGQYRKLRIVLIGDDAYFRHMIRADTWIVHARRATNTKQEELEMFASFEEHHAARLRPVFQEIGRRLDLDFFGVDCAMADSGEVVLFEANACMAILGQTQKERNVKAAAIDRIRDALADRVASPQTWRRFRPLAAAGKAESSARP